MEELIINNSPLITTVIPTYRRPELLKRAVLSVLNQTYPYVKVCIYDNASGDSTKEVVEELIKQDPRVHYYCHSNNMGSFNNFYIGMRQVNTPYFSILSDDDILLPDFYEKALEGFKKYPDAIFSATQTLVVKGKKVLGVLFIDYEEKLYCPFEGLLKIADGGTNSWTGSLYKKEVIETIGLDESLAEGPMEQDFLLRLTAKYPYVVSRSPGAIFIVHDASVSASRREIDAMQEYMQMINKIKNNIEIPIDIRETICQKIKKNIVDSLWPGGWIDIKQKNFSRVKKIAKSLKDDFKENLKSAILSYSAKMCKSSRIFYYCFIGLNQVRRFIHLSRNVEEHRLQAEYGTYLAYLNKYSKT